MTAVLALAIFILLVIPVVLYFLFALVIRTTKRPPRWIGLPADPETEAAPAALEQPGRDTPQV